MANFEIEGSKVKKPPLNRQRRPSRNVITRSAHINEKEHGKNVKNRYQ